MGRTRILDYALVELDRLATANDQVGALLPRMRLAADDPILAQAIDERIAVNMDLRNELGLVYAELIRERTDRQDPLVLQFCRQAADATEIGDPVLRDLHISRALLALDQWLNAVCMGLTSLFRQLYQDPVADSIERGARRLRAVSERIVELRPSLTQLHHDEEAHGHDTRSPIERSAPDQLSGLALAGRGGRER